MGGRVCIKFNCYDPFLLDGSVRRLMAEAGNSFIKCRGPIPLPTRRKGYTVIRSPHVNKSSMEQFELRLHRRLLILEGVKSVEGAGEDGGSSGGEVMLSLISKSGVISESVEVEVKLEG